ncbi:FAD-binding and (Fe-S)-binding domain-containing protein [Kushneria phosphatilytica]|uniref:D-2-hydroxyglutarate dehydrogenase n=1 Tax=Kushneria phosphatilytica TaxID=657387 RepID=A0A1S1NXH5_9GAMM|nr:FAD-binding and (Fe-S)-binding domain-containing protein [Kushneria phosphatilytica]OHV12956.1 FAD-binding oxidoreductase [Kushneria phosphatilytica]QEL10824.1 FAD-binding oxidoreductase [Kushneria phosphatilytica]
MIETLDAPALEQHYQHFLDSLKAHGFRGDIAADHANRTVLATDNSIYQRLPQAVLYPLDGDDLALIARLMAEKDFQDIVVAPRGGGTGTNGQSLTDAIVVDVTRHMHHILEIDAENHRVRVQAGVVKDQLNAALRPHGLFFAPELSTSNRATIAGMVSTDASGQGSRAYGKTRDHVLELDTVLVGGERFTSRAREEAELDELCSGSDRIADIHRTARNIIDTHSKTIAECFPPLNRCLTGYDLAHLRDEQGRLDLNSLLCGSEGSLGFIAEATLNVLPLPRHSALINVRYAGFMDALRDARTLMGEDDAIDAPTSIETVDDKVLMLAMEDIVWDSVAEYFPPGDDGSPAVRGINLVEFNDDDEQRLEARIEAFVRQLEEDTSVTRLGHTIARGREKMTPIYGMRKRAVGLLGNTRGERRPIPFVEDTAVPPEHLAEYIEAFRALLDEHGLEYGMFGHVDAGVLHVRPAIDMKDPEQAALIRLISDRVVELTRHYGGLLWGEHGKGVRSEYTPAFFGELYPVLQQVKTAFDPRNQLNPGKIATPLDSHDELLRIDGVPTRGEQDRQIDERVWERYESAVYCNGNGACYNYDPNDAMCPSWKATRERVHSPKGRASLMREWLRRQGNDGVDVLAESQALRHRSLWQHLLAWPNRLRNTLRGGEDFSHEVHDAMDGCLSCKSCAGQCPIRVNVPDFRSRFLELYYGRYLRPARDHLLGSLETLTPWLARIAPLYNGLLAQHWVQRTLKRTIGLVDAPTLSVDRLDQQLEAWGIPPATPTTLGRLTERQKTESVILVQDTFTSHFDAAVVRDIVDLLARLDIRVFVAPYHPGGKPSEVLGMLGRFERTARYQAERLRSLARFGVPLVGIDPAMTLIYRQEYPKTLGEQAVPKVMLLQEWLLTQRHTLSRHGRVAEQNPLAPWQLLSHCTEKTNAPGSGQAWQQVFNAFGLKLELVGSGCCGMSGTYGHEAHHRDTSETIYGLSWQPIVEQSEHQDRLLATGYSCRSQVKRFSRQQLQHPAQALLRTLVSA